MHKSRDLVPFLVTFKPYRKKQSIPYIYNVLFRIFTMYYFVLHQKKQTERFNVRSVSLFYYKVIVCFVRLHQVFQLFNVKKFYPSSAVFYKSVLGKLPYCPSCNLSYGTRHFCDFFLSYVKLGFSRVKIPFHQK